MWASLYLMLLLADLCAGWFTADKWRLKPGPRAGRLEVMYRGRWGTTCDDSFDIKEAKVACRKLGLPTTHARVTSVYGPGTGPIWLDDLRCSGYESSIDDCSGNSWGSHDCDHSEDIGVVCSSHAPVKWRVHPGPRVGSLQAFFNGQWRELCSSKFSNIDAKVACKNLGLPYGNARTIPRVKGRGTSSVWMNEPQCTGVETALDNCPGHRWATYSCSHNQVAGIMCTDGGSDEVIQTRLEPGPDEGKLEVFYRNQWRTVCDRNFGLNEAKIVCGSLGYEANYTQVLNDYGNGRVNGPNQMISMACRNNADSVEQCQFVSQSSNLNHCQNGGEVAIKCNQEPPLRLVPGPSRGRLEVYWDGEWGTVCDDNFTINAAKVVCSVLGQESDNGKVLRSSQVEKGSGRILLDDVTCTGDESSFPCSNRGWGVHNCEHAEDVGIDCSTNAPVRLSPNIGGLLLGLDGKDAGRLEVFHNGQWGSVCNNHFAYDDGRVVCRQLGHNPNYTLILNSPLAPDGRKVYDVGKGKIWMDDVNCTGSENFLDECEHRGWGRHDCFHFEDVGIICDTGLPTGFQPGPSSGLVLVIWEAKQGTVCSDHFSYKDAKVVCRSKNLPTDFAEVIPSTSVGESKWPIWLDDLGCTGSEKTLEECPHRGWGVHNCQHSQDVSVSCPTGFRVRLNPGPENGLLEVYRNGTWGTVCGSFSQSAAEVVCRERGLETENAKVLRQGSYGTNGTIKDIRCDGTETALNKCRFTWSYQTYCSQRPVHVSCRPHKVEGVKTRLLPGGDLGKVEVFFKKQWRTVCDKNFTINEAKAVCKTLGYEPQYSQIIESGRGIQTRQMISSLVCRSNVESIEQCRFATGSSILNPCQGGREASVKCNRDPPLRLIPGPTQGRLEVYWNGEWGTICDDNFTTNAAKVACNVLGLESDYAVQLPSSKYEKGSGRILLDDVTCTGDESSFPCKHRGWGDHNCEHREDVGIDCSSHAPVRLIPKLSGIHMLRGGDAGRLEVFHNGQWGSVCNNHFSQEAGGVVCRQLGYDPNYALIIKSPLTSAGMKFYEPSKGRIWMDDVNCTGSEAFLDDCEHRGWGSHDCFHFEDVGIVCRKELPTALKPGPLSGLAFVIWKGEPGTICSNNFSYNDARVLCRTMGVRPDFAEILPSTSFGEPELPIWLDDLGCTGSEKSLVECPHRAWGVNNCQHSQDVSVSCPQGFRIRLNPGPENGLLEVFRNGTWGTVCGNFSRNEAKVVCREKGLETDNAEVVRRGSSLTQGTIKDIQCNGTETALNQCRFTWHLHPHCLQGPVRVTCNPRGRFK